MHAHKCFVRYRKYGVRELRNYEKQFVQVLPKLVPGHENTYFLIFSQVWGQICSEGTWVLMHIMKGNPLKFIGQKSKLWAGDVQAR